MTMPGSAPVRAGSPAMLSRATEAGTRIVELVREGVTARQILTVQAIENAIEVALAVGGSVNCVRHLAAIANEADLDLDVVSTMEHKSRDATQITAIRPNGRHQVWDLERVGGTQTVLGALLPRLHSDARTVCGRSIGELAMAAPRTDGNVVRSLEDPVAAEPGLLVLRGTLAPDGSIVKTAGARSARRRFTGPAKVFSSEEAAIVGLSDGRIKPGDVVVLRGMGPRGGPGTVFAAGFVAALNGAGLAGDLAVVTDGELSGLNRGLVVGQVMPEAADGGPLAGVQEGDTITIDLDNRLLDTDLVRDDTPVFAGEPTNERGWLGQYHALVGPIQHGATLRRPRRPL